MSRPTLESTLKSGTRLVLAVRLVWRASPGWTLCQIGLVAAQGLLPLAGLIVLKRIVDAVTHALAAGSKTGFQEVVPWLVLAGILALATSLSRSLSELAQESQSFHVTEHISRILHEQSIAVDLAYYEDSRYHDTLHRAQREAGYRPTRIVHALVQVAQAALALAGIVILLLSLDWTVGVLLLVAALPGLLVRLSHSRRLFALEQQHTGLSRRSWYYNWLITSLQHAAEIRLLDVGRLFARRAEEIRHQINQDRLGLAGSRVIADSIAQAMATAAVFGALALICYKTVNGVITIGGLAMYYQGFQSGLGFLQTLLRGLAGLYEDSLFLGDFQDFLAIQPRITGPCGKSLDSSSGAADGEPSRVALPALTVRFEGVSFSYPGSERKALEKIDFEAPAGGIVALAGENGAGKSTLIRLLARLYDPDEGRILANGVDLRDLDPAEWRLRLSMVSQDYSRFHFTARENIWVGDVRAPLSGNDLHRAAETAGASAVIERLPAGYDSTLGRQFENGVEISAGEWQRVVLARALFREDAPLIVLDEPTSSLDPFSEADLLIRFRQIIGRRSAILISHRFSALRLADLIYVLRDGRITERGTHEELIRLNGHYARLFQIQATLFESADCVKRATT
ncbi:MAG: ABC transporter ATP-binding protein [Acidobacteriota bacterium]